jgi:hypothetical protein
VGGITRGVGGSGLGEGVRSLRGRTFETHLENVFLEGINEDETLLHIFSRMLG